MPQVQFPVKVERSQDFCDSAGHDDAVAKWIAAGRVGRYPRWPLHEPPRWNVTMPHQCDAWEIVDDAAPDHAVACIDALIAALVMARRHISAGCENGVDFS